MIHWVAGIAAWVTAIGSLIYILGDPQSFSLPFRAKYLEHLSLIRLHGVFAALTLLLGPLQFRWPTRWAHRYRGYAYLLSVMIGGATGFFFATKALGGPFSKAGFCLVALLWWYTGYRAYSAARQRDFNNHRVWMIRNFALAFGAVVLRVYLQVGHYLGVDFLTLYPTAVWVSWVPSMLVAELWIQRKT